MASSYTHAPCGVHTGTRAAPTRPVKPIAHGKFKRLSDSWWYTASSGVVMDGPSQKIPRKYRKRRVSAGTGNPSYLSDTETSTKPRRDTVSRGSSSRSCPPTNTVYLWWQWYSRQKAHGRAIGHLMYEPFNQMDHGLYLWLLDVFQRQCFLTKELHPLMKIRRVKCWSG